MRWLWPMAAACALALAVLAQNLFGRELNRFFLAMPGIDKILHVAEYFAVFLVIFWLAGRVTRRPARREAVTWAACLVLAMVDEGLQRIATDRNFEMFDLAADIAGLTLGWVAATRPPRPVALAAATMALSTAAYVAYDTHTRLIDYSRALQHERRHEFAEARMYYLRALANGLRNPSLYNELAWVSVEARAGTPEEAVNYARLAYQSQPRNPDVLDTYGWSLHYAGRSAEALPYLKAAFDGKPDMFCIHYHLGEVYAALSEPGLAEQHFRQQIALRHTREAALAEQALDRLKGRR